MTRRSPLSAFALFSFAAGQATSAAFHVSPPRPTPTTFGSRMPTTALDSKGIRHSPLEDSPWESDPSYYDRLREAARDPETFEAFVASTKKGGGGGSVADARAKAAARELRGEGSGGSGNNDDATEKKEKKKKGGYQRIEEWDAQQRETKDGSGMTWEEKVQFEGLRDGNGVRQNDILMHHLHTY